MMRALGFDLGTANMGWAVIEANAGSAVLPEHGVTYRAVAAGVFHTKPDATYGRKTHDDLRRLNELHRNCVDLLKTHDPVIVGYESYAVFDDKNNEDLRDLARKLVGTFGNASRAGLSPDQLRAALSGEMFGKVLELVTRMSDVLRSISDTRGRGDAAKVLAVQGLVCSICFERLIPVRPFTPADLKRRCVGKASASKEAVATRLSASIENLDAAIAHIPITHRNHAYDAAGHALLALENR